MSDTESTEEIRETTRLLRELDRVVDESSMIRDIAVKYEALRDLERLTGPSHGTRTLREEIVSLENRLRLTRA